MLVTAETGMAMERSAETVTPSDRTTETSMLRLLDGSVAGVSSPPQSHSHRSQPIYVPTTPHERATAFTPDASV